MSFMRRVGSACISPRTDVLPPPSLRPLSSYNVANGYRELVTDANQPAKLRNRFESYKKHHQIPMSVRQCLEGFRVAVDADQPRL
jgi:hypothetical protein